MTLALPHTLSSTDAEDGTPTIDRVQENFDELSKQFPVSIANASQVPQARVFNSIAIPTVTAVAKTLTFDSERYDTASLHNPAVNPSRLTCVTAGLHSIKGNIDWPANGAGFRQIQVLLNGATIIGLEVGTPAAGFGTTQAIAVDYRLVVGDYVELVVAQTSGGGLNVNAAANYSPEFSMHWVSP